MHKKSKTVYAAFLIIVFSAITSSTAFSQRSYDADKTALKEKIVKYRGILSEVKRVDREINESVEAVEIEFERIDKEISNAQTQIRSKDKALQSSYKDLERTKNVLHKLQSAEKASKTKLDKAQSEYIAFHSKNEVRLVTDYKDNRPGIRMLFASTSYGDFKRRFAYLRMPVTEKKNILINLKRLKDSVSAYKKQLAETQRNIKKTSAFITSKQNDIRQIESIISDRKNDVSRLKNEQKELFNKRYSLMHHMKTIKSGPAYEQYLAVLERENKLIEAELNKMKRNVNNHAVTNRHPVAGKNRRNSYLSRKLKFISNNKTESSFNISMPLGKYLSEMESENNYCLPVAAFNYKNRNGYACLSAFAGSSFDVWIVYNYGGTNSSQYYSGLNLVDIYDNKDDSSKKNYHKHISGLSNINNIDSELFDNTLVLYVKHDKNETNTLFINLDKVKIDSDDDGLNDLLEYAINTNPNNKDTDGDGLNDIDDDNPKFSNIKDDDVCDVYQAIVDDIQYVFSQRIFVISYDRSDSCALKNGPISHDYTPHEILFLDGIRKAADQDVSYISFMVLRRSPNKSAAVKVLAYHGPLAGGISIYELKYKNGKWFIVHIKKELVS